MLDLIAWASLGIVAGAIAKLIYPGRQGGDLASTMLLGLAGAFLGGSLYALLTTGRIALVATGFNFGGLIVAIVGAVIAIFLWSLIARRVA